MSIPNQEELYKEILKYFNYAEELISIVENSDQEFAIQQFAIVEEVALCLEKCADKLSCDYIEFLKNGKSPEISDSMILMFNEISLKTEECRKRILSIYNQ